MIYKLIIREIRILYIITSNKIKISSMITASIFFDNNYISGILKQPRCPNNRIVKSVCVTQSCKYYPFICLQQCSNSDCQNAHKFCKTMQWQAVLDMLNNYEKYQTPELQAFMQRIQKIYQNLHKKINTQSKIFYQYIQDKLYSHQYKKIKYHLNKQQFGKITSTDLGKIITKLTKDKETQRKMDYSIQEFTLREMKQLDENIDSLLKDIEKLYICKFKVKDDDFGYSGKGKNTCSNNRRMNSSTNLSKQYSLSDKNRSASVKGFYDNDTNINPQSNNLFGVTTKSHFFNAKHQQKFKDIALIKTGSTNFTSNNNFYSPSPTRKLSNSSKQANPTKTIQFNLIQKMKVISEYPKHINSRIITNASILNSLITTNRIKQYKLIYRASQNSFGIQQFYKKMALLYTNQQDKNILTAILVKTQYGKIIGGCTKLKWCRQYHKNTSNIVRSLNQSLDNQHSDKLYTKHKQDVKGSTYFFSIDLNQRYQLQNPKYAIYCGSNSIGFGKQDLRIYDKAHKNNKSFIGFPSSFNYPSQKYMENKKSSIKLNGSRDSSCFKIQQWEVFEVKITMESHRKETAVSSTKVENINKSVSAVMSNRN